MTVSALEQRRRDLKASDPELYAYVAATEQRKAYQSGAGLASGAVDNYAAANRLYARADQLERFRRGMG